MIAPSSKINMHPITRPAAERFAIPAEKPNAIINVGSTAQSKLDQQVRFRSNSDQVISSPRKTNSDSIERANYHSSKSVNAGDDKEPGNRNVEKASSVSILFTDNW